MASSIVQVEDFCQLVARYGNGIAPIEVTESEPVVVGRGSLTGISDELCAEAQVSLNERMELGLLEKRLRSSAAFGANFPARGRLTRRQFSLLGCSTICATLKPFFVVAFSIKLHFV